MPNYPKGFEVEVPAGDATKVASPQERIPADNTARFVGWIPPIGAMAGGLIGSSAGPGGAILGAGIGGGAGETVRSGVAEAMGLEGHGTNSEFIRRLLTEMAAGAGSEAVGIPLSRAFKGSGEFFMNEAMRPGRSAAKRFAIDGETPNYARAQLNERLPVGDVGDSPAPSKQIRARRKASSDKATGLLQGSTQKYTAHDALTEVQSLMNDLEASTSKGVDQKEVLDLVDAFINDHPGLLSAEEFNRIKQFAQSASKNTIQGRQSGGRVAASDPNYRVFNDSIQKGIRKRLAADIPGLDKANARTKDLIMLRKVNQAIEDYAPAPVTESSFAPGALLSRGVFTPRNLSRAGLLLDPTLGNAASVAAARQSPRALLHYLQGQMMPDNTNQYPEGFTPE